MRHSFKRKFFIQKFQKYFSPKLISRITAKIFLHFCFFFVHRMCSLCTWMIYKYRKLLIFFAVSLTGFAATTHATYMLQGRQGHLYIHIIPIRFSRTKIRKKETTTTSSSSNNSRSYIPGATATFALMDVVVYLCTFVSYMREIRNDVISFIKSEYTWQIRSTTISTHTTINILLKPHPTSWRWWNKASAISKANATFSLFFFLLLSVQAR